MSEKLISTPAVFGDNGNFLLERELGAGGMGGVYMGRDKMLDRPVAVKVMLKELGSDPEFLEKFKKETIELLRTKFNRKVDLKDVQNMNDNEVRFFMEQEKMKV